MTLFHATIKKKRYISLVHFPHHAISSVPGVSHPRESVVERSGVNEYISVTRPAKTVQILLFIKLNRGKNYIIKSRI